MIFFDFHIGHSSVREGHMILTLLAGKFRLRFRIWEDMIGKGRIWVRVAAGHA